MNTKQVTWAKDHDWFAFCLRSHPGCVFVKDYDADGCQYFRDFEDFQALREWAGY